MRVRYNPDDPNDVMIWAPLRNGCFIGIFVGLGLLFVAIGTIWIVVAEASSLMRRMRITC